MFIFGDITQNSLVAKEVLVMTGYGGGPPSWAGRGRGRGLGRGGRGRGFAPFQGTGPQPLPAPSPGAIRVVATTLDDRGVESQVSPRFARAPFIVVVDIVNGAITNAVSMPNPFASMPGGAGVAFAQWIIGSGARIVITPNIGPNASMVLQQAGITVYNISPGVRVIDALRGLGLVRM